MPEDISTLTIIIDAVFLAVVIAAAYMDFKKMIIPNGLIIFGMPAMLVLRFFEHTFPFESYVIAGLVVGALFFLASLITKNQIGGGDFKLWMFVGFSLGIPYTVMALLLFAVIGMAYAIIRILATKDIHAKMVLGPFTAVGALIAYLFGEPVVNWLIVHV